jgi:hypothetical protein
MEFLEVPGNIPTHSRIYTIVCNALLAVVGNLVEMAGSG